jgi:hypothetical protein
MMDPNSAAGCQLIDGIIGACKYLKWTKRSTFIKQALLRLQQNEEVQEILFPTEMAVLVAMFKRTRQDFCVDVGPPGRDFTVEHYSNETLYVFNKEGQLIEVIHEYPPE